MAIHPYLVSLYNLTVGSFTGEPEFRRFLALELECNVHEIDRSGDFATVVFETIEYFRLREGLGCLAEKLAAFRPLRTDLAALRDQIRAFESVSSAPAVAAITPLVAQPAVAPPLNLGSAPDQIPTAERTTRGSIQGQLSSPAAAWRPPAGTAVFVDTSELDADTRSNRDALYRALENVGYLVFPNLVIQSADGEKQHQSQLEQALLWIQVLGARPSGTERADFAAARRLGKAVLRWRLPNVSLDVIAAADPQWHLYPTDTDPQVAALRGADDDGVQAILREKFLSAIDEKVRQILARGAATTLAGSDHSATRTGGKNGKGSSADQDGPAADEHQHAAAGSRPGLLVTRSVDDAAAARQVLAHTLRHAAQRAKVAAREVNPNARLTDAYRGDPGLIVFQGKCSLDWLQQRVEECEQIVYERPGNPPAVAIYVSPCEGQRELSTYPFGFHYLKHPDPAIDAFLAEVMQSNSVMEVS